MKFNNFDDIFVYYGKKEPKYLYLDKKFYIQGIDYTSYVKLNYKDINEGNIKSLYTINGWYILFYLMCNAIQAQYITTTIKIINKETKIKQEDLKKILKHLKSINMIKIKEKTITEDTILHIAIIYNNIDSGGYRAIPIDYLKTILPTMTSVEWAILSVLLVRYRYFIPQQGVNEDTGEIYYFCNITHYAFPTQKQIHDVIGSCIKTIRINTQKLIDNNYHIITINKGKSYNKTNGKLDNENIRYNIPLMERIEYIYYYIINVEYNRDIEDQKFIEKHGYTYTSTTDKNNKLIAKDYLIERYNEELNIYKECLNENNSEKYINLNKQINK